MLHGHTFLGSGVTGIGGVATVRQHVQQQGIVKHRVVKQQLLLSVSQVVITPNAPIIRLEEPLESLVVGREHRLRTRAVEGFRQLQVVNQPQIGVEGARQPRLVGVPQFLIDASAKPVGLRVCIYWLVLVDTARHQSRQYERDTEKEFLHKLLLVNI